jgi:Flp pilus assembly protein TadD
VLSNLGLSYLLSKDLPKAEETLRRAYAHAGTDPRVRMNLAVVLGLQGKTAEAENIAKANLPVDEASANVAELKRLLARNDNGRSPGKNHAPVSSGRAG